MGLEINGSGFSSQLGTAAQQHWVSCSHLSQLPAGSIQFGNSLRSAMLYGWKHKGNRGPG